MYERLGDVRELLVVRAKVAVTLIQRGRPGDREEARRLLGLALDAAKKMGIPEVAIIEGWLARLGPDPAGG